MVSHWKESDVEVELNVIKSIYSSVPHCKVDLLLSDFIMWHISFPNNNVIDRFIYETLKVILISAVQKDNVKLQFQFYVNLRFYSFVQYFILKYWSILPYEYLDMENTNRPSDLICNMTQGTSGFSRGIQASD